MALLPMRLLLSAKFQCATAKYSGGNTPAELPQQIKEEFELRFFSCGGMIEVKSTHFKNDPNLRVNYN